MVVSHPVAGKWGKGALQRPRPQEHVNQANGQRFVTTELQIGDLIYVAYHRGDDFDFGLIVDFRTEPEKGDAFLKGEKGVGIFWLNQHYIEGFSVDFIKRNYYVSHVDTD